MTTSTQAGMWCGPTVFWLNYRQVILLLAVDQVAQDQEVRAPAAQVVLDLVHREAVLLEVAVDQAQAHRLQAEPTSQD